MKTTAVIDLNVFVKALLKPGRDRIIYKAIKEEKITPVLCQDIIENLSRVLIRPHLKIDIKDIKELLEIIRTKAVIIIPKVRINACRDNSDNIILEAAIAGQAKAIITNDPDLLILHPFKGIPILTSRQFIKEINK